MAVLILALGAISPLLFLAAVHFFLFVANRIWARADARFARYRLLERRASAGAKDQFCLILRSSRADAWLSIDIGEFGAIQDSRLLRIDVAPGFRESIVQMMRPFYTLFINNSSQISDALVLEYANVQWQAEVLRDMADAAFLIIAPIWPSEALRWELEQILANNYMGKTFVLMPPYHLIRSELLSQAHVGARLLQSARHLWFVTRRFASPDDHIVEYPPVANAAERIVDALLGWSEARELFSEFGLELPKYDPIGSFVHAELLAPEALPTTPSRQDQRRILESVGRQEWWYTNGQVLASVAGSKSRGSTL